MPAAAAPLAKGLAQIAPDYRLHVAQSIDDALAQLRALPKASRVIVVGGDGTLNRLLPAFLDCKHVLALVPCGTGNDTARALGLFVQSWQAALEVMMVRRAAQRCTPADLAELEAIETVLEGHIAHADHAAVVAENRRFHQTVNRIADNVDALPIVDKHWMLLAALWRNFGYGEARFAGVANDHRHLIMALSAHDQEVASMIMGAHATKAKLELLARIASQSTAQVRKLRRA